MSGGGTERPLLIEPVVSRPREAEAGRAYLVTVDLRGPLSADGAEDAPDWPYQEEELTFTVGLDGAPHFVCEVLDDPSVVLHRFGGTYGPVRFVVTAGQVAGPAGLWLTISNEWGMPVRKAELPCRIREPGEGAGGAAAVAGYVPGAPDPVDATAAAAVTDAGEAPGTRGLPERPRAVLDRGSRARGSSARSPVEEPPRDTAVPGGLERPGEETAEGARAAASAPDGSVLIVFAGSDRIWADWIGDRLGRRGLRVSYRRWDPSAEVPLAESLRELARTPGRILLVLSERFFEFRRHGYDEWSRALWALPAAEPGRFVAVAVTSARLPTAGVSLSLMSLADLRASEAEERLLFLFGLDASPDPGDPGPAPRYPADAPRVWGGVPRRNTRFTGREQSLNSTYQALRETGPGTRAVTLHGMSGVGKTQLAAEYAHRFAAEYDVVWWIAADNRAACRQGLAELAPELGLVTGATYYGERVRAVLDALRRGEPYRRWLLVLDGADEPDELWDLVPEGPGHVLITSRNRGWAERRSALMEVPVYDRDESVALIRSRAPRLTRREADELAEALEDLPLLLDQTAGWLHDADLSVAEYVEVLHQSMDRDDVVRIPSDSPVAFQTAWSILLGQLREAVPSAVDLLQLLTFFAPGAIPVRLVRNLPPEDLPPRIAALVADPEQWDRVIGKLRQYAVVRAVGPADGEGGEAAAETLSMHRMVCHAIHRSMSPQVHEELIGAARRALTAADPGNPTDVANWPRYAAITPHLIWADALQSTEPAMHTLVLNCLRHMYISGEYGEGIDLGRRAWESWRLLLGADHPRIWDLSHHYANLLRAVGDYAGSEAIDRAAANHLREERGREHPAHLRAASGLAADLRGLGRYEEARELSGWIFLSYRELLDLEDARTLNARNNLAVSLRLLGRYEESRALNGSNLTIRRRVLGPVHRLTLYSELHVAIDLRLLGRYQEAEELQTENFRTHQRELGPDNPQTLRAGHNLALCRYLAGDPAAAGPLFAQTLERCDRVLGGDDPLTMMVAASCAWLERETGDPARALGLHRTVEERYTRMLGRDHPFTAGVRGNLGLTLLALGERGEGHEVIEEAYARMLAAVGAAHPWTVGCALNTAAARLETEDRAGALALSRENADAALRALGPQHPLTLACQAGLAAAQGQPAPTTVRTHWDFEPQTI
ncbi:tetratricopeptide repeat protein [Streptomyces sp. GMY02]|uniref:FxSxx-COOH system tetratricopeptide repeat protein n=1 Tax=Streptomyces sp. GMY02 TaxID=1333528 RepID=UPI001C2C2389|nr:FxSxx-COOH system tetratricopeptide repeat protein [Streptomyces sp. GMY02]QXE34756.1 tetratricopeptide repeat protein [Streptomyces sp. GMY02]